MEMYKIGDAIMMGNYDYNNEEVMKILNNAEYSDEQKKELFEKYKADLKDLRRKEIINRLNECAKNNPIITQEEYINFLKKYNDDDLSKPFEVIEEELRSFSNEMDAKYREFLAKKEAEEAAQRVVPEPVVEETPVQEEITPDVVPVVDATPVVEEPIVEPEEDITPSVEVSQTVFENKEVKEVMPEEIKDSRGEKGNASAIIISIIAIIIGMVIMYAIIKLK